jgi:soluble lytic murein transglycosylase-like protein
MKAIISIVLSLALEIGVDVKLALSIIEQENPRFDRYAVHHNANGTRDLGIMQLNSGSIPEFLRRYWNKPHEFDWTDPEDNIYIGLHYLKSLLSMSGVNEWQAIICYNAGTSWLQNGKNPPGNSIEYANAVFLRWKRGNQ